MEATAIVPEWAKMQEIQVKLQYAFPDSSTSRSHTQASGCIEDLGIVWYAIGAWSWRNLLNRWSTNNNSSIRYHLSSITKLAFLWRRPAIISRYSWIEHSWVKSTTWQLKSVDRCIASGGHFTIFRLSLSYWSRSWEIFIFIYIEAFSEEGRGNRATDVVSIKIHPKTHDAFGNGGGTSAGPSLSNASHACKWWISLPKNEIDSVI